jgi:D-glycero-D-manno-heptose 1,7-bisphosphate phosphatase
MALFLVRRRRIAEDNLSAAIGPGTARPTARAHFVRLGRSLVDTIRLGRLTPQELLNHVTVEGRDRYDESLKKGRGVILLAAHFGAWELMPMVIGALGYPLTVVGRPLDNPFLNEWIVRYRARLCARVLNSKDRSTVHELLSALRRGESVGILGDQHVVGDRGVYVEFFGRLAYTHKIAALAAAKTGASVVPVFMIAEGAERYRFVFERPIVPARTGHREEDAVAHTQAMTRVLEEYIRRYPDHWFWLHERWRLPSRVAERAVFMDRDGTIIEEVGYLSDPAGLRLIPAAATAIRMLNRSGLRVVVVTNQSGVARGFFAEETVHAVHRRLEAALSDEGGRLDGIYYCPHHPTEGKGDYTMACDCRKPATGMMEQAARDLRLDLTRSFVIGDKDTDVELARRAGARGILVLTGYGREHRKKQGESVPDYTAQDLLDAVQWILRRLASER